ncbi:FadR/GntR family transcriptional regulator [Phytoactinopolyspora limicola]|uniref:FadR/GntR family transcriptional regulator n=1 Tax=Phytoactinopolyspora limicola TaxID=2715536 RepID=UPI0014093E5C|nr:FadR/GntR family transcriptional regulator [Phytoactinopolyspora limicola]
MSRALLTSITDQGLRPGDELASEGSLATEFGVSKPVLREAVRSLEAVGVVVTSNGRPPTVGSVTSKPLRDYFQWVAYAQDSAEIELLEVRQALETQCAILAADRATDDELTQLSQIIHRMSECSNDPDTFIKIDTDFHLAIAHASHNTLLSHLLTAIQEPIQEIIRRGLIRKWPHDHQRIYQVHADIAAALEARDSEAAYIAMARHFTSAIGRTKNVPKKLRMEPKKNRR